MILYLDASALVKRYLREAGSDAILEVIDRASRTGTGLISRPEVSAAFAKAVRTGVLRAAEAETLLGEFRQDWSDLLRVEVTETAVARADTFAWQFGLRGYDAVHLALASLWQEVMGEEITIATFDRQLWTAAGQAGLIPFPSQL